MHKGLSFVYSKNLLNESINDEDFNAQCSYLLYYIFNIGFKFISVLTP